MRLKSHFTKVDLFDNTIDPDNDPDSPSQNADINYTTDSKEKYSTFIPKSHWQPPRQGQATTFVSSVDPALPPTSLPNQDTTISPKKNAVHCTPYNEEVTLL